MGVRSKSGGGKRKYGRNEKFCEFYRSMGQEETNRRRRIARHERWQDRKARKLKRRTRRQATPTDAVKREK